MSFCARLPKIAANAQLASSLSGTGSDGSEGLKAVKSRGGFVIVQEPSEAAFDGMPKSAIQTGQADLILPVAEIPAALISLHSADANPAANDGTKEPFLEVLSLVRTKTGHDFYSYKTGTLIAADRAAHGDGGHN